MKTTLRLIKTILCLSVWASMGSYASDESCGEWRAAEVDPTEHHYQLEMRICDLPMGLSAYVQIKNPSEAHIALSYRIITKDDKHKDSEVILEPGVDTRAENCQVCATRKAGFKSWQILKVEVLPEDKVGAETTGKLGSTNLGLPAFMNQHAASKPVVTEVAKPQAVLPVEKPALVETVKPAALPKLEEKMVVVEPAPESAPTPETNQEGIKAGNGTIIPYDQLPPEFRPKK